MTDAEKKAAYKERLEQKTVVTSRLSETTRFIAFGIVAWVFAIHASSAEFSVNYIQAYGLWINTAGVLAVVSIASDYFQYLCAYFSVKHALLRADHNYKYNKNHLAYLLANCFFHYQAIRRCNGCCCDYCDIRFVCIYSIVSAWLSKQWRRLFTIGFGFCLTTFRWILCFID